MSVNLTPVRRHLVYDEVEDFNSRNGNVHTFRVRVWMAKDATPVVFVTPVNPADTRPDRYASLIANWVLQAILRCNPMGMLYFNACLVDGEPRVNQEFFGHVGHAPATAAHQPDEVSQQHRTADRGRRGASGTVMLATLSCAKHKEHVMAKRKAPRPWFEPCVRYQVSDPRAAPNVEGIPEDAASLIVQAWQRIDDNADWIIWGSNMADPCIAEGFLSGEPKVMSDRRIIAVRRWLGPPDGSPDHEAVAKRICECVNSMRGIADPVQFVDDARALFLALMHGEMEDPREDNRVVSLLGRCIPPEELESIPNVQEF